MVPGPSAPAPSHDLPWSAVSSRRSSCACSYPGANRWRRIDRRAPTSKALADEVNAGGLDPCASNDSRPPPTRLLRLLNRKRPPLRTLAYGASLARIRSVRMPGGPSGPRGKVIAVTGHHSAGNLPPRERLCRRSVSAGPSEGDSKRRRIRPSAGRNGFSTGPSRRDAAREAGPCTHPRAVHRTDGHDGVVIFLETTPTTSSSTPRVPMPSAYTKTVPDPP